MKLGPLSAKKASVPLSGGLLPAKTDCTTEQVTEEVKKSKEQMRLFIVKAIVISTGKPLKKGEQSSGSHLSQAVGSKACTTVQGLSLLTGLIDR